MKAARERVKKALTINTKKDKEKSRRSIREVSDAEVHKTYKIGRMVMESTNAGMEVVFATRLEDGVEVVIKTRVKKDSFKSAQEEREWRQTTEYQLNMPVVENLCQFLEVLETRDMYYVIMEKVEGRDLFEQMSQEHLSHVDAREIVKQILEALRAMHREGRIHKDLKIENVMVDMDSPKRKSTLGLDGNPASPAEVKLIDFDTVQDWEPSSPKARDVLGTDGYIAPEAYNGDYSPASDVYAVGVMMYKMLTGKFPTRPDIFDDQPGENWVGSPAMKRIQERLKNEIINFNVRPFTTCQEAAELCALMLAYEVGDRPSAEEALQHSYFTIRLPSN